MISEKEKISKIKSAFWDYNICPQDIYMVVVGKKEGSGIFTREKILIRLLERLSWYEIIDLFGKEFLRKNLRQAIISKIRNPEIRNRYEFIRRILQKETVSFTGWSVQNRKRLESSILSHRWYGA